MSLRRNPELLSLEESMRAVIEEVQQRRPYGACETMDDTFLKLSKKIGSGGGIAPSFICVSVKKYRATGLEGMSRKELRALCGGISHSCKDCTKIKITDDTIDILGNVLNRLESEFKSGSLKSTSWFDLLFSYFNCTDKGPAWGRLRQTLLETFPLILNGAQITFPWMRVLSNNQELLGENPCSKVADELIRGDAAGLDALREVLRIPDSSWFWQELLLAQADSAAALDDKPFIEAMPKIISAVRPFSSILKDAIIGKFLTRYLACQSRGAHEGLKEFTLENWGPPNLKVRQKYDTISPDARRMVQEWIARQDLEDFFTLLQEDRVADERRLKFWSRYIKQIEFHRILLGADARRTSQADFVALRRRPSAGSLTGSTSENNSFVMQIGNWALIESSSTGYAVYGYQTTSLPFRIDAHEVAITSFRRGDDADFRADHRDRNDGTWEEILARKLDAIGIQPDEGIDRQRRRAGSATPRSTGASQSSYSSYEGFSEIYFWTLVKNEKLVAEDHRKKGGALWVLSDLDKKPQVEEKLSEWGFKLKRGKGWWRT